MRRHISFICHYWQWPILVNCVSFHYLCVLRWLIRQVLALNCLLQIEQKKSEEESSVDALALAFRCARFYSVSLILFASYSPAPFLMRPCHFVRSCAICSHYSIGMLKSLREALRVSLYRFFWPSWEGRHIYNQKTTVRRLDRALTQAPVSTVSNGPYKTHMYMYE